jgi:hypothetical protein
MEYYWGFKGFVVNKYDTIDEEVDLGDYIINIMKSIVEYELSIDDVILCQTIIVKKPISENDSTLIHDKFDTIYDSGGDESNLNKWLHKKNY